MLWKSVATAAFLMPCLLTNRAACGEKPHEATYEFIYTARVTDLPESAAHVDLWIPVPSDSQGQKVNRVKIVRPGGGEIRREPQ